MEHLDRLGFDVRTLPSWVGITDTVLVSLSGRQVDVPLPPDGAARVGVGQAVGDGADHAGLPSGPVVVRLEPSRARAHRRPVSPDLFLRRAVHGGVSHSRPPVKDRP